jgi:ABC-type multidrug transport system ATPase subunit
MDMTIPLKPKRRPWYWILTAPFQRFLKPSRTTPTTDIEATSSGEIPKVDTINSNATTAVLYGDDDVTLERDRITSGSASKAALIISLARKRFGSKLAVKDVSVAVDSGEILALLGPNGAGKTTLVSCVLGLYRLTSGTARINGFDITRQQDQVYRHVGICPQHEILWPDLTCEEHLLFYARLKGVDKGDEREVVGQCLEQVELVPEGRKLAKQLSGGQKRRLSIAIALVARPAVVFLDEPTTGIPLPSEVLMTGLDPNVKRSLWRVIKKVKELHNMCIVLTTHSMYRLCEF